MFFKRLHKNNYIYFFAIAANFAHFKPILLFFLWALCLDGNWRQQYFFVSVGSYYARDGACLNGIGLQLSRGVRLCFAH